MQPILIYSTVQSPRLTYVLNWLFASRLQVPYQLIHNPAEIPADTFFIAYGEHFIDALTIPAHGLLTETGVRQQNVREDVWYDIPVIFPAVEEGDENYVLPFDLFSAIFFLLSRYEEYYTYTPDKHGRYPATESELYKKGLLREPIIDEWVHYFRTMLQVYSELTFPELTFSYTPTYDIDIAYSYLGKGIQRNIGGFAKDLLAGNMANARERAAVLRNTQKDPYDSFEFIASLHKNAGATPLYFILCALRNTPYDKNILPTSAIMVQLVQQLQKDGGHVFIHPSYYAQLGAAIAKEKKELEHITGTTITSSRQHYIKNILPRTYRQLIQQGITNDYSMGYATHVGFRAGTSHPFPWYDIAAEAPTQLTVHPFCFMDTAARYEEKMDAPTAFKALHLMAQILKQNGGHLTTVLHNFSLGTSPLWQGWAALYKEFVTEFA